MHQALAASTTLPAPLCANFLASATAHSFRASGVRSSSVVLQSLFLTRHTLLANMLQWCFSEGVFSALDGAVASVERLWHGKEDRERHKKQHHQKAKKVSCSGFAA